MMEKVLLVIFGNFPTTKAYGVTTANTIQQLKKSGHEVLCVAFQPSTKNSFSVQDPEILYFKESLIPRLFRKLAYVSFGRVSQIAWKLVCMLAELGVRSSITKYKPTIVWARESVPKTLTRQSNPNQILVIELHSFISQKALRSFSKFNPWQIILAPISISIQKNLEQYNLPYTSVLSPMGVNLDQFKNCRSNSFPKLGSSVKIGYFGKLAPGGFSKGFEDLINLAAFHESLNFASEIQLVGADISEIPDLEEMAQRLGIRSTRIKFMSHRPHGETIKLMQDCDVLVLTTPKSSMYSGSPIKAIEYAATGKPVLASKSSVNEDVFPQDCQPYWYEIANVVSMHETLLQIYADPERDIKTGKMRKFAESRTWEIRTNKILAIIEDKQKKSQ